MGVMTVLECELLRWLHDGYVCSLKSQVLWAVRQFVGKFRELSGLLGAEGQPLVVFSSLFRHAQAQKSQLRVVLARPLRPCSFPSTNPAQQALQPSLHRPNPLRQAGPLLPEQLQVKHNSLQRAAQP